MSHDIILTTFIARALGRGLNKSRWPDFLHGALLWKEGAHLWLAYQDWMGVLE